MRIAVIQLNPIVGDLKGNLEKILEGIDYAKEQQAQLVIFPELSVTGYPPEDFLLLSHFIDQVERCLDPIIAATQGIAAVVGTVRRNPLQSEKQLFNTAAVIENGKLLGFQDKSLLPTYDVFDEGRYFEPAQQRRLWEIGGERVAITICEDIWKHSEQLKYTSYRSDPVQELKGLQPSLMVNLSASPYSYNKPAHRLAACAKAARTLRCPAIMVNQVGGNDSLIFDGYSFYVGADGALLGQGKGFEVDRMSVDTSKKGMVLQPRFDPVADLYNALVLGVRDYFHKSGFKKACLGLSGGVDSALVACIAAEALGQENVLALGMASRYTSEASVSDAEALVKHLGIEFQLLSIEGPFKSYLELLHKPFAGLPSDATEENIQARIRGMLLMAFSNKLGYIVLSTGNKSELAMGYSTLYGDMCGGLAVISDLTKQQVYALANWINRQGSVIPQNIIDKAPTAELRPDQKDSDSLPDYKIVDNVLQAYVEEHQSPEKIAKKFSYPQPLVDDLVGRIHRNEYKRRQSPPGLRISEKAFSVGRRFPIVQRWL
jgi:NAD+ synthase (glutamine-hydrolysing)